MNGIFVVFVCHVTFLVVLKAERLFSLVFFICEKPSPGGAAVGKYLKNMISPLLNHFQGWYGIQEILDHHKNKYIKILA